MLRVRGAQVHSWCLGACIPPELLGEEGLLSTRQRRIQSLCLITDGACPISSQAEIKPPDFSTLRQLQSFSWTGLYSPKEFHALRSFLASQSTGLWKLQLGLVDWGIAESLWNGENGIVSDDETSANFFATSVLQLEPGDSRIALPSLRMLSLAAVSLEVRPLELAYALNFTGLRFLKLWHCLGTGAFLQAIVDAKLSVRLTTVEISNLDCRNSYVDALINFLRAFKGLQSLRLLVRGHSRWQEVSEAILAHSATLKELVLHEMTKCTDDRGRYHPGDGDLDNLDAWAENVIGMFRMSSLDFLGLTAPTQGLVRWTLVIDING